VKPLFRWAGGKRRLVPQLEVLLPSDIRNRIYNEPFLGGGALALHLLESGGYGAPAYLSDSNWQVVNAFKRIHADAESIADGLDFMSDEYDNNGQIKAFDDAVRLMENALANENDRAVAFIFVQQASFNGLWRVNSKGKYNVPFGYREKLGLPSRERLIALRDAMHFCIFEHRSANHQIAGRVTMESVPGAGSAKTFWYLDPPYVTETGGHTKYTADDFDRYDHRALIEQVNALVEDTDAKVMISAADNPTSILTYAELHKSFSVEDVFTTRSIAANGGKRKTVTELVYRNYSRSP
jgi:DNA adenine methylase